MPSRPLPPPPPLHTLSITARLLTAALALGAACSAAPAAQRGQLDDGSPYVCGGIGREEIQALHAERSRYSLWVSTLAQGTGAYLSDARLQIRRIDNSDNNTKDAPPVFDRVMDGPWCFVTLPPGRYQVTASWVPEAIATGQTLQQQVTLRAGDHRQAVFRFAIAADVAPDHDPQFGGNPYGAGGEGKAKQK